MEELQFATEDEADETSVDCSWSGIIRGIKLYSAFHPASARDVYEWVDLLEGIRELREAD